MKFLKIFMLVTTFLLMIRANPLPAPVINELMFTPEGWIIETTDSGMMSTFDGCFLTSLTDTAFFKAGIPAHSNYLLIIGDSLLITLYINPAGDEICFFLPDSTMIDALCFGNGVSFPSVFTPLPGQSICREDESVLFYLDNTPTPGAPNDFTNAIGYLEGYITDSTGVPLPGIRVERRWGLPPVYTDSSGYFGFQDLATLEHLTFHKPGLPLGRLTVQVWPDSTVTLFLAWNQLTGLEPQPGSAPIAGFELKQNYPNPFNPTTTIRYQLAAGGEVELAIYNLLGERIRTLVNAKQPAGDYQMEWNGQDDARLEVASGIYIYRLKTGKFVKSRKMLLLR